MCLPQLDPLPLGANLGFVYLADPLGEMADIIVDQLRRTTGIEAWIGATGQAVLADNRQLPTPGGMAVLVAALPAGSFHLFDTHLPRSVERVAEMAIIHADHRLADLDGRLASLAAGSEAFLVGGVVSSRLNAVQLAGGVAAGTISGLFLGGHPLALPLLNHGCSILGPPCRITSRLGRQILSLDELPALDLIEARAGDLLRRDRERLVRQIWLGEENHGRQRIVARLLEVDPERRRIVIDTPEGLRGDRVLIMRRDAAMAQRHLYARMEELRGCLDGAAPGAILYFTTADRGSRLFGPGVDEAAMVQGALGRVPLVGLVTDAAIYEDRVESFAAAAALLV